MKSRATGIRMGVAATFLLHALCAFADAPKYYLNANVLHNSSGGTAFVNAKWWNDVDGNPGVDGSLPDSTGNFYAVNGYRIDTPNETQGATVPFSCNSLHVGELGGKATPIYMYTCGSSVFKVLGEGMFLHNGTMGLQWYPVTIDGSVSVDSPESAPFVVRNAYSSTTLNIPAAMHSGESAYLQFYANHGTLANDKVKDTFYVKLLGDYSGYSGKIVIGRENDSIARFTQLMLLNGDLSGSVLVKANGEIAIGNVDVKVGGCMLENGATIVANGGCLVVTNDFAIQGTVGVSFAGFKMPNLEFPKVAVISVPAGASISSESFRVVDDAAALFCKSVSFSVECDMSGVNTLYASFTRNSVYVSPTGSDADTGANESHAFATLAHAVSVLDNGVIYALPGTYDSGECDLGACTHSRVHVPSNVVLKSTSGAKQTFIVGAPPPYGGATREGAARCARLDSGAVLQGFSLTGGYVYDDNVNDGTFLESTGAGVRCSDRSVVMDCRLYGNTAVRGGAGHGGSYVRCWFGTNTATKANWAAPDVFGYIMDDVKTYCFDCVFTSDILAYYHVSHYASLYNCTFPSTSQGGPVQACKMYNCLIKVKSHLSGSDNEYRNCILAMTPEGGTPVCENCIITNLDDEIDSEYRLVSGGSSIDVGNWDFYLAGWDAAGIPRQMIGCDYRGGQRVYNAQIDAGAVEYDWRSRFSKELYRRFQMVYASPSVATNAMGGLRLSEGEVSGMVCHGGGYAVLFNVVGGGLAVYVNGVLVGESSGYGEQVISFNVGNPTDEIKFVAMSGLESPSLVMLKKIVSRQGLVITFH